MAYITREDGERFVIPSYRDVLSGLQKTLLKKDILVLSQNYGEYITLQRKVTNQYEVAFSPDSGYLLGESIWHQFKRPEDMIYCEAIPNSTDAILVIVKSGSVYLDGSFPLDSISEELIVFLTQQNNFEIYLYGDVPISETPTEGKFSFEPKAVKSFTILDKPVFPTLPLLKIYQLKLVDQVLKEQGIGVFPTKQLIITVVIIGLIWMAWSYLTAPKPVPVEAENQVNPYQLYYNGLTTPHPDQEISKILDSLNVLLTMPGWVAKSIDYASGSVVITVQSTGGKTDALFGWAKDNGYTVSIRQNGIFLSQSFPLRNRPMPKKIYPLKAILGDFIDKVSTVYPGNHLKLNDYINKNVFTEVTLVLSFDAVSPVVVALIAAQLKDLPLTLQEAKMTIDNGSLSGSITIEALGS